MSQLIIDLDKNKNSLNLQLKRMRNNFPGIFLPDTKDVDLLNIVREAFFTDGFTNEFYVFNTSLKKNVVNLTIRPVLDTKPHLKESFPNNISLSFRGFIKDSCFIVESLTDIHDSEKREFEKMIEVKVISTHESRRNADYSDFIFTTRFISELPEISMTTKEELKLWIDYLNWKNQVTKGKSKCFKYVSIKYQDNELIISVIFDDKDVFALNKIVFIKNEIKLYENSISSNKWRYEINDSNKIPQGYELGDFKGILYEGYLDELKDETLNRILEGSELNNPYVVKMKFDPDADYLMKVNEITNDDEKLVLFDEMISELPKDGFIGTTFVGDMFLINRQKKEIEKLTTESGYSPFLSSWLFDIKNARVPNNMPEIKEFMMKNLNEDQKTAVKKMLAAPEVFLLQGPPGTGKTTVIAEAVYQFAKQGKRVLIASQTHLAVDNVLERLMKSPVIRAVRLGKKEKISQEGLIFAEDNAINYYFETIAHDVRKNKLEIWQNADRKQKYLADKRDEINLIVNDIEDYRKDFERLSEDIIRVEEELKKELAKYEDITVNNRKKAEMKVNLSKFYEYLKHKTKLPFIMHHEIQKILITGIVNSLNEKPDALFFNSLDKLCKREDSQDLLLLFLDNWEEYIDFCSNVIAKDLDILKGKTISDDSIKDIVEIDALKKREEELRNKYLETDDMVYISEWRSISLKIKELENKTDGNISEGYNKYFVYNNEIRFSDFLNKLSQEEKINYLSDLLKTSLSINAKINVIKNKVSTAIMNIIEKLTEDEVNKEPIEVLTAKKENLNNELNEIKESIKNKKKAVEEISIDIFGEIYDLKTLTEALDKVINDHEAKLEKHKSLRIEFEGILNDWAEKLESFNYKKNKDESLNDLFISYCNVVGISCNEKSYTLIKNNLMNFDVVIIDEVSKATPPELLMPMMKGKQIILVGDHRQLPPIFNENDKSYEEMIKKYAKDEADSSEDIPEESDEENENNDNSLKQLFTMENFNRFKEMVTSSLFKRYFEEASEEIKHSLIIQYRMHPAIMDVINCFYEGRLEAGFKGKEADAVKAHKITIKKPNTTFRIIKPEVHAYWFDTSTDESNNPVYSVRDKSSWTNRYEAESIFRFLKKIDEYYTEQGITEKKQVGIVSFYGKQVKILQELKRKTQFSSIKIDVNTVDKFQGKEKPIIIVSMVRNSKSAFKKANSFIAAYQRINVAFSRAQELLAVFGAADMFKNYPVTLPNMDSTGEKEVMVYKNIIEIIKNTGGYHKASVLNDQAETA